MKQVLLQKKSYRLIFNKTVNLIGWQFFLRIGRMYSRNHLCLCKEKESQLFHSSVFQTFIKLPNGRGKGSPPILRDSLRIIC
jgi:hypothetical protein